MTVKDAKLSFIADVALDLFLKRSVSEVTIKDLALSAGMGEATLYRYFANKKNVVVAAAEKLQKSVFDVYFKEISGKNGYEKICDFFSIYVRVFSERPSYFRFVSEFDSFMISEGKATEEYSSGIDMFKSVFLSAYAEGIKDGSVRKIEDPESFYYGTGHAMLELCKKLSIGEKIVRQDETTDAVAEISGLKDVILFYLAPRKPVSGKIK